MHLFVKVASGSHIPEIGWHWNMRQKIAAIAHATHAAPMIQVALLNASVSKIRRYISKMEILTMTIVNA